MMPHERMTPGEAQGAVNFLFELCDDAIDKAHVRCRVCDFAPWSVLATSSGRRRVIRPACPGCDNIVCLICGCTDEFPCVRDCKDGRLLCSWFAPGVCIFCFWQLAEHAYLKATGRASRLVTPTVF